MSAAPQPSLLWSFNGSNVDSINRLSPALAPGTTTYVSGLYGQAIKFDQGSSSQSYIRYDLPPVYSPNNFSFSYWVNMTEIPVPTVQVPVYISTDVSADVFFRFSFNNNIPSSGPTQGRVPYGPGADTTTPGKPINQGTWVHLSLVSTWNGTSNVIYMYQNGISYYNQTVNSTSSKLTSLYLSNYNSNYSNCAIQDLRLYNTALTATQVFGIYQSQGIPPSGTLQQISAPQPSLSWSFNGTMRDSIQGLTFSPAQSYSPALYGQGASFSNVTGQYDSSVQLSSNISTSPGLTLSTWFNGSLPYTNTTNNMIFFRLYGTSSSFGLIFTRYSGETGTVRLSYLDPVTGFSGTDFIKPYILNQWYHICIVANNFKFYIYVNGKQAYIQNYNTESIDSNSFNSFQLLNYGGTNGTSFTLSDARVYTTALSNAQVLGIYNSKGIPPTGTLQQVSAPSLSWSFNGTMRDSIQGLTLTGGGTPVYAPALYGQGLSQSTTNFSYNLPDASNITTVNGLTVSCWINQTSGNLGNTKLSFFVLNSSVNNNNLQSLPSGASNNANQLNLTIFFSNGKLGYVYNDYGAGYREYNSKVPSLNTWYHMCVVVGGGASPGSTSNTLSFYINGTLDTIKNLGQNPWPYLTDMSGTMAYNSLYTGYVTNNTFVINDARVYNTALTATQVLRIYQSQGIPPRASLP
jgi:hypothetical protein